MKGAPLAGDVLDDEELLRKEGAERCSMQCLQKLEWETLNARWVQGATPKSDLRVAGLGDGREELGIAGIIKSCRCHVGSGFYVEANGSPRRLERGEDHNLMGH